MTTTSIKTDYICDIAQESRKGRKPINGRAMTPAERKRHQRKRESEKQAELPRWRRYRLEIVNLVVNRFVVANAAELSSALSAVALGLSYLNTIQHSSIDEKRDALLAILNPADSVLAKSPFLGEFAEYAIDEGVELNRPGFHKSIVVDLFCDVLGCHESANGGAS